jgi:hypothetical protein
MTCNQGPILSTLSATGLLTWVQILAASERNSTQLLINAKRGAKGQTTDQTVMYPN